MKLSRIFLLLATIPFLSGCFSIRIEKKQFSDGYYLSVQKKNDNRQFNNAAERTTEITAVPEEKDVQGDPLQASGLTESTPANYAEKSIPPLVQDHSVSQKKAGERSEHKPIIKNRKPKKETTIKPEGNEEVGTVFAYLSFGFSILALIFLIFFFPISMVFSVLAIVFGISGLKRLKRLESEESVYARIACRVGLIIGITCLVIALILLALVIAFFSLFI